MPDLNEIARSLAKTRDLHGALALANANGLPLADTLTVYGLVLSNRVLRAPVVEYDDAGQHFADLIRPDVKEN